MNNSPHKINQANILWRLPPRRRRDLLGQVVNGPSKTMHCVKFLRIPQVLQFVSKSWFVCLFLNMTFECFILAFKTLWRLDQIFKGLGSSVCLRIPPGLEPILQTTISVSSLNECGWLEGRPRLFKGWITLSTGQITIQWIAWFVLLTLIHWIAIYPVDSVIQPLNNRGQVTNWA